MLTMIAPQTHSRGNGPHPNLLTEKTAELGGVNKSR